jgi:hypothetical protein
VTEEDQDELTLARRLAAESEMIRRMEDEKRKRQQQARMFELNTERLVLGLCDDASDASP